MRLKVIACNVFLREISLLAARSETTLDISYIPQGLHNYPDLLRSEIQKEIDEAEAEPEGPEALTEPPESFSGIVLAFGLCSRALCGVRSRKYPLVLPRSHDCIAVLLGSHRRYEQEFNDNPGTYWFSPGWVEQSTFPCGAGKETLRRRYEEQYGEDNAEFLVEHARESLSAYKRAALITWPELDRKAYHERAQQVAKEFGWRFESLEGSSELLARVLNGTWEEKDVVIAEPGHTFEVGNDTEVVSVVPCKE